MLVRLSFEYEVYTVGYPVVVGVEYRTLSELEYQRFNSIDLSFIPHPDVDAVPIKMEVIDDPDLVKRIVGIESYLSTDDLYTEIIEGDLYHDTYIRPPKELFDELSKILSKPIGYSEFDDEEDRDQFIDRLLQLDQWSKDMAILISDFMTYYQDHRLVQRLIDEHPDLCHMVWLGWFIDSVGWEGYEWIDRLISSGRQVDEIDEFSEEQNLLSYICDREPNPYRLSAVKHLLDLGSNPDLIVNETTVRTLVAEYGHPEYLSLFPS